MNALTHTLRRIAIPVLMTALLAPSLPACQNRTEPPPPVDDTRMNGGPSQPNAKAEGMSTKTKVVMLAGAAALYYMYKQHQKAPAAAAGEQGQYYLSKNGRVYYRDADHRAHWVTAPPAGIQVPESEAGEYRAFQGYDNSTTGRDLTGLGTDADTQ